MPLTEAGSGSRKTGYAKTLIPWILVGLALGVVGGAIHAHRGLEKSSMYLSQLTAFSEYEELANLQYKHADMAHARQSLQDLLSFMDRAEANQKVVDKNVFEFDRGVTYMRLALLEERSGNNEASRGYMVAAEKCFKRRQSKDHSEAYLREITAKLDSSLP